MAPILRLAENLRWLRLEANLTQEQFTELLQFNLKFYQKLEGAKKPQVKVETVERLAKPFGLEAWQMIAPLEVVKETKRKMPRARTLSPRGPRAKWKGQK